jgi:hypothetical protein
VRVAPTVLARGAAAAAEVVEVARFIPVAVVEDAGLAAAVVAVLAVVLPRGRLTAAVGALPETGGLVAVRAAAVVVVLGLGAAAAVVVPGLRTAAPAAGVPTVLERGAAAPVVVVPAGFRTAAVVPVTEG